MPCVISPDRADHGMILFTPDGRVEKMHLDVVIPVLHGLWGEDGTVQGLLELAGIAYVGCGVLASSVCMDKAVANALFEANGVPHTKWVAANRWEIEKDLEGVCAGVEQKLGWPVFVKPANAGSSVGISKVSNQEELKAAIALALENDRKVVFEAFVDGQEVECAVIGSDPAVATRPGEILAGAEFYTYDDKYKNGVSQTVIPAHLPEAKLDEVKTYAAMAYTALNCEGLARCDFFVEKNTGRVLINEINTFPGFTAISMYPKLMEHEGLPVPQLIDRLIALLKGFVLPISDYAPFEYAVVTAGGVRCDEVNRYTMESLKVKGLYFAGEVLDLDANTGGYNLQIAFSTGRLAGQLKQ